MTDTDPASIRRAHLRRVKATQARLNDVESKAAEWSAKRDRDMLAAQVAGATYADLQEATGLSEPRVTQILRRARTAQS